MKKDTINKIIAVACVVVTGAIIYLLTGTVDKGVAAMSNSYNEAYAYEKDLAYSEKYDSYKQSIEKRHHVSNNVSIEIGELRETQKLEVLKVSDVEFIIEEGNNNANKITSWLEVPGEGVFVVDMAAGEYIVDNERNYVHIRVPYPELTNVKIDYADVEKVLFENGIFFYNNEDYATGEELARKQLDIASMLIKKEFISNQRLYLSAQDAAKTSIETLVRQLNPDVEGLSVEVGFY